MGALYGSYGDNLTPAGYRMSFERDMQEEMAEHLRQTAETYERRGMSPEDARRAALREFGNVGVIQEQGRDARGWRWLEFLIVDLKYGIRQLARQRGFAVSAILILSLGIGLDAALFAVVRGALFAPPRGVVDPGGLVLIDQVSPAEVRVQRQGFTTEHVSAYAAQFDVFQSVGAWYDYQAAIGTADEVVGGRLSVVSKNYFATVQAPLAMGAGFAMGADGSQQVIVTSAFWRRRLRRSPDAIGQRITIAEQSFVISGVAPEGFTGVSEDDYMPGRMGFLTVEGGQRLQAKASTYPLFQDIVVRLRPGVSRNEAQTVVAAIGARNGTLLGKSYVASIRDLRDPPLNSRDDSGMIAGFAVIVGLILLGITTTNVASLFLVRAASRQREIAVRLSLGASRLRVVRQLLTEACLVAAAAATGALLVLFWVRYALRAAIAESAFAITVGPELVAFTAGITILSVLLFALSPALHATRFSVAEALKAATPGATSRRGIQVRFVVLQIALTQPFLIATAAAVSQSLAASASPSDVDFEKRVLVVPIEPAGSRSRNATDNTDRFVAEFKRLPGVVGVAFDRGRPHEEVTALDGTQKGKMVDADVLPMSGGWAEMRRLTPLAGRFISRDDDLAKRHVAVLDLRTARALFGDANPIGRQILVSTGSRETPQPREVIGIRDYAGEERPLIYVDRYHGRPDRPSYSIETTGPADALVPFVRRTVRDLDPNVEIGSWMATLATTRAKALRENRLLLIANLAGAVLALLLAGYGLYAIIAFSVNNRVREIGVRIVLGASQRDVMSLFMRQGAKLAAIGLAIGFPISLFAVRGIQEVIDARVDLFAIVGVIGTVLAVGWLATWIPARRAAVTNPIKALRAE
jgi:putative ABC transport system permease protein